MVARPQKPVSKLQDKRAQRVKRRPETVLPGAPQDAIIPKPPPGLLKVSRALWADVWQSPVAAIFRPSDSASLTRWIRYVDQHERLHRRWKKVPIVRGSKGQPRRSPAFDMALVLAGEIRQLEDRLGLNPAARMRLGLALADQADALDEINRRLGHNDEIEWVEG